MSFHDTHVHTWTPPARSHCVTGTWAMAAGQTASTIVVKKTANAETSVVTVPYPNPHE